MALAKSNFRKTGEVRCSDSSFVPTLKTTTTMKKLLCILAGAALFGACEQKTEVAPAAPAEKKTETNTTTTSVDPSSVERKKETTNTLTTTQQPASLEPKQETKEETTTTTTTSSPNP
jgi:PBP1b-binding outer membrane lipoprotein LpoB